MNNFNSSEDYLVATVRFEVTVDLFSAEDWVRVGVHDDFTHLESMRCLALGFVEQDT